MSKVEFDIALISAGAYSYPLALHAKKMGKIGIHTGGGLQLFFGILGKRWEPKYPETTNYLSNYINGYWVRPSAEETPENSKMIENGCYW